MEKRLKAVRDLLFEIQGNLETSSVGIQKNNNDKLERARILLSSVKCNLIKKGPQ